MTEQIYICPYCKELTNNFVVCKTCATFLKKIVNFNKLKTPYCEELTAPFVYDGMVRKAVLEFKFKVQSQIDYSSSFAFFMKQCNFQKVDLIIGVPAYKNNSKFKIYRNLILDFCRMTNLKSCLNAVKKIKPTKKQHECGLKQRLLNLEGVFTVNEKKIKNKSILICDDVITSGATVNELAKILKKSGAKHVSAIAIAVSKLILKHGLAKLLK